MIAEETGKSTKGFSALLLDLPTKSADKTLLFEKQFYIAKYPKSADDKTVLSFDTDIKFKNFAETAKAKITLKGKFFKTSKIFISELIFCDSFRK